MTRFGSAIGIVLVALSLWLAPPARADVLCPVGVSADEFARLVRAEVARAYEVPLDAVSLAGLPTGGRLPLPAGVADGSVLRVRDQTLASLAGRTSLPVDILEGGKLKRMLALPVRTTVLADVVVVQQRVARGSALREGQVVVERRPIHSVQRGSFRRVDEVLGHEPIVDLVPGMMLTSYLVRGTAGGAPAIGSAVAGGVRSGAEVTVRISSGGLSLVGKGRVLDSGDVGDTVRVRLLNFADSKVIRARVLGAQEVRVIVEETP